MNLGGRGCSEPSSQHGTPAWHLATEQDSVSKQTNTHKRELSKSKGWKADSKPNTNKSPENVPNLKKRQIPKNKKVEHQTVQPK